MPYRTITSTQIQPVIWLVLYRQPKRDITPFYLLAGSLNFLHVLLHIVARVMTRIAVELFLTNFVRSSELRFARWDEFDFDKSLWRIPAKREEIKGVRYSYRGMKMKEEHIVPLSRQAMVLLEQLSRLVVIKSCFFRGS